MWHVNWYQRCGLDPVFSFKSFSDWTASHISNFYLPCGYGTASQNPFHLIGPAITKFLLNHLLCDNMLLSNGLCISSPLPDTQRSPEVSAGGKTWSHLSSRVAEYCQSASSPAARNNLCNSQGFSLIGTISLYLSVCLSSFLPLAVGDWQWAASGWQADFANAAVVLMIENSAGF